MVRYWLKMIGANDRPLQAEPYVDLPELRTLIRFPREDFPGVIHPDHRMVLYAVGGWLRIFAVVKVLAPPRRDVPTTDEELRARWPHGVQVQTRIRLNNLNHAPLLERVSPELKRRIHKGVSHLEMYKADYDTAVKLLREARDHAI
jgi:hypothetical protein